MKSERGTRKVKCTSCDGNYAIEQFKQRTATALFSGNASDILSLEELGEAVCPGCGAHHEFDDETWKASGHVFQETKPVCKLVGEDGNVFNIIGKVSKTLKRAGQPDKAQEFTEKAMSCESYDAVLQLVFNYVDVE